MQAEGRLRQCVRARVCVCVCVCVRVCVCVFWGGGGEALRHLFLGDDDLRGRRVVCAGDGVRQDADGTHHLARAPHAVGEVGGVPHHQLGLRGLPLRLSACSAACVHALVGTRARSAPAACQSEAMQTLDRSHRRSRLFGALQECPSCTACMQRMLGFSMVPSIWPPACDAWSRWLRGGGGGGERHLGHRTQAARLAWRACRCRRTPH